MICRNARCGPATSADRPAERVLTLRLESGQGSWGRLRARGRLNQGANSGNGRTDSSITRGGGETMALKDYYSILGVSRTETARGIQNTFHELVKRLHRNRGGPQ